MVRKRKGVGKGHNISGIPLSNSMSQLEGQSAEPNRDEPGSFFQVRKLEETRDEESYARDYFRDEEARLGSTTEPMLSDKEDRRWSEGLQDEANMFDPAAEGSEMLEEAVPLHLDPSQISVENVEQENSDEVPLHANTAEQVTDSPRQRLHENASPPPAQDVHKGGAEDKQVEKSKPQDEDHKENKNVREQHGRSSDSRQSRDENQDKNEDESKDDEMEDEREREYGESSDSQQEDEPSRH